jgi:hypothetical protein
MRRSSRRTAILVAAALAWPMLPALAAPPACGGRDIAAELQSSAPEAWGRIREAARATANGDAILWRLRTAAGRESHLFGTIHLTDERIVRLPPAADAALASATTVALEVADLSPATLAASIARLQRLLVYTDGRSLSQFLSAEEQTTAAKSLERAGMPPAALAALKPWVVTMTMSLSDCERQRTAAGLKPLDLRIGERGAALGAPVVGLETIEDQLLAMSAVPDADQLIVLRASLKLYAQADDMIETMVRRYLARDIGAVWPLQEELWRRAGFDTWAFQSFRRELVTRRNIRMRDAALPLIERGGAFIAVGALHLPGDDGLVALLRKAGLTVEPVE